MINLGDGILPDPGQNLSIDVFPKENSIQQGQNSCMTEEAMAQFMNEFDSTKEKSFFSMQNSRPMTVMLMVPLLSMIYAQCLENISMMMY